jgi:hypothetical protein
MKIRIHGNSVRARLSRNEVAQLREGRLVQQETVFSHDSRLVCIVTPEEDLDAVNATFNGSTVTIALPLVKVAPWANSEEVGMEGEVQIDAHNFLRVLVEKDFACLHSRTDEADDAFPNPLAQQPSGH